MSADDSDELATVIDENSSSSDIKIEKVTVGECKSCENNGYV